MSSAGMKRFRTTGSTYNFVSMRGGKYFVPPNAMDDLVKVLTTTKPESGFSLVPQVSGIKTPIIVDMDFYLKPSAPPITENQIKTFLEGMADYVTKEFFKPGDELLCAVFMRKRYPKKYKETGEILVHDGFHLYMCSENALFTGKQLHQLRNHALQENLVQKAFGALQAVNPPKGIYDLAVTNKSSWPMLPFGSKPFKKIEGDGGGPLRAVLLASVKKDKMFYFPHATIKKGFSTSLPEGFARVLARYVVQPQPESSQGVITFPAAAPPSAMEVDQEGDLPAPPPNTRALLAKYLPNDHEVVTVKSRCVQLRAPFPRQCILTGETHNSQQPYVIIKNDGLFYRCHSSKCPGEKRLCGFFDEFAMVDDAPIRLPTPKPQTVRPAKQQAQVVRVVPQQAPNLTGFYPAKFLAAISSLKLTKDQFLDSVVYFAKLGFPADKLVATGRLATWKREAESLVERVRTHKGSRRISKSTIQYIFTRNGIDWKDTKAWKIPKYCTYNDYEAFIAVKGKTWFRHEFEEFIRETISFVAEKRLFVFTVRIFEEDAHGNQIPTLTTKMDADCPFTKTDAFKVRMWPDNEALKECLAKAKENMAEATFNSLMSELDGPPSLETINKLKRSGVSVKPEFKNSASLVRNAHQFGLLPRYIRADFRPYLITDPCPNGVYNLFRGFPLYNLPRKGAPMDRDGFAKTITGEWLRDVIAGGEEDVFEYLINYFTFTLQYPQIRAERVFILMSEVQGIGKSSMLYWFHALYGQLLVCVCAEMSHLNASFNGFQQAKKIIFVDDAETATKKQSLQLKSRTTIKYMKYNEKNEKILTLRCVDDIWCSTNKEGVWMTMGDRRPMFFQVSPCWLGKTSHILL